LKKLIPIKFTARPSSQLTEDCRAYFKKIAEKFYRAVGAVDETQHLRLFNYVVKKDYDLT
jgi:hypothetical protein